MKPLGKIEFFYRNEFLVVKSADRKMVYKIGYNVYGPDLSLIGKALDVLGPADEPRIFVKLARRPKSLRESTEVYYNPREVKMRK